MKIEHRDKLSFLSGGFIIAIATSNIIATKPITLCVVTLSAGIITYLLTFVFTYAIDKVW